MNLFAHCFQRCLVLPLAISLIGCGGPTGPATRIISGKVTLNGKPLEKGAISFIPGDGQGATAGANIANGTYTATVPLGSKRVEIRAPKVVGTRKAYDTPDSPTIDIVEELIPSKYNSESELKLDVSDATGAEDFRLEAPISK